MSRLATFVGSSAACLSYKQKMSNRAKPTGHDLIVRLWLSLLPGMCRRPHQEEACSLAEDFKSASDTHGPMYTRGSTHENTHSQSRFLTSSENNSAPRAVTSTNCTHAQTPTPRLILRAVYGKVETRLISLLTANGKNGFIQQGHRLMNNSNVFVFCVFFTPCFCL